MKFKGTHLFFLLLLVQMVGCASSRKPVTHPPNHTKAEPKKEAGQSPATKPAASSRKEVKRRENDSLDRIYPLVTREKYKIALLLPFYLYKDDLTKSERNASMISQDFYRGFLMGIDTLKHCGINLEVFVLESDPSGLGIERLKDTLKRLDIDLVIGPLLEVGIQKIAPFCSANKINLAAPVATLEDTCFDKTYYLESNPGPQTYGREVAKLVKRDFKDCRIFLINDKSTNANPISKEFVGQHIGDSLHVINYNGKGANTFTGLKGFSEKNVIFIPSRNEIFVSSLMSQLQLKDTMGYETTIIGLYPWLYFKSLEGSVWQQYHLHLAVPFHIDYSREESKGFVANFRVRFNDEPNEYGFRGYDEIVYYGTMLAKYGKYFQRGFADDNLNALHSSYHFERFGDCSGFRNTGLHIIKFDDYEFKELKK